MILLIQLNCSVAPSFLMINLLSILLVQLNDANMTERAFQATGGAQARRSPSMFDPVIKRIQFLRRSVSFAVCGALLMGVVVLLTPSQDLTRVIAPFFVPLVSTLANQTVFITIWVTWPKGRRFCGLSFNVGGPRKSGFTSNRTYSRSVTPA